MSRDLNEKNGMNKALSGGKWFRQRQRNTQSHQNRSGLGIYFLAMPPDLRDLSSPTRDQPGIEPGPMAMKAPL